LNGEYGVARKVTKINGAATRVGNIAKVKKGIMNGRLPIIMCKNFRDVFEEMLRNLSNLPETKITAKT
jgi:hypothetical protein